MTFMDFVQKTVATLADDPKKADEIVKKIEKLPKKQAMVITAYICDHLSNTLPYGYFLAAIERQAR